jgi:protein-S-isoprenylcysteine O-methyltransferase Ste14
MMRLETGVPSMNWNALTRTKAFDLTMAAPLIAWNGYNAMRLWPSIGVLLRPSMAYDARQLLEPPEYDLFYLELSSLAAGLAINLLLIWLLLVRDPPARKSRGLLPRLCALGGSFLGVGITLLQPALWPLPWQALSTLLTLAGGAGSVIVLARLGKAFSIMPEARRLVTGGPYAFARHPLYAVEMITIIGLALQFQQPWAGCLALGFVVLQVTRSIFEERVLVEAYPEYVVYRMRTARFIPGIL